MPDQKPFSPEKQITRFVRAVVCFISLFLFVPPASAQSSKAVIRTAADLKTGNSNDVLISFFQLAVNDITGKSKSFKFQSSLFGIKAKTDSSLLSKQNFLKERFSRNFVVSLSPTLDQDYKFKSNSIGFKYAIVNNRDKSIFNYFTPTNISFNVLRKEALNGYLKKYNLKVTDPEYRLANYFFYEDDDGKRTDIKDLPKPFRLFLDSLKKKTVFKNTDLKAFRDTLYNEFESLSKYVENRGLWTISSDWRSDNNGKLFSDINFHSEYLKGMMNKNARSNLELNLQADFNFADDSTTVSKTDLTRKVFSFHAGFNWILLKNKHNKSLLELKGALATNNILSGAYTGEKSSSFTAEGTFRIRITDQVWLPFDIRYDPKKGNVFGFLSIKTNFDALRNQ